MRSPILFALLILVGLLAAGCAGGMTAGSYSETIGTSSRATVQQHVPRILRGQYGYRLERRAERGQLLRYRTYWKEDEVLADEQEQGFTSVRTRILVTAKPRDRSAGTYTATMEVDYQVKKGAGSGWVTEEMTPAREDAIDKIYQDLSDQLSSGVMER